MNIDLGLSIAGPAFRFGPEFLFLSDEEGTATGNPFEAFTDTAGTTAADFGDAIARINDRSPNARNALQSSSALRPLLGRAPVEVRNRANGSALTAPDGFWRDTASSNGVTATKVGDGVTSGGLPYVDYAVTGTATADSFIALNVVTAQASASVGADWFASMIAERISGAAPSSSNDGPRVQTAELDGTTALAITTGVALGNQSGEVLLSASRTLSEASANGVRGQVSVRTSNGQTVDYVVRLTAFQFERGTERTAYQANFSALNITESGFPSPAFIRPDLSDDVLPTEFPDGFTGDVMVFGRKGSWIERDVEIASAGSLNIGPTTFTGAPAGVLAALGDIVGWVAVERTLTDFEVARLVQYHRARGAADLIDEGDL